MDASSVPSTIVTFSTGTSFLASEGVIWCALGHTLGSNDARFDKLFQNLNGINLFLQKCNVLGQWLVFLRRVIVDRLLVHFDIPRKIKHRYIRVAGYSIIEYTT